MKRTSFTLLGLILAMAIIFILSYMILNIYFKIPILNKNLEKSLSEQGIDTSSHKAMIDTTRGRIQDLNRQLLERTEAKD
jgi:hypothetical protein